MPDMTETEFEAILDTAVEQLGNEVRKSTKYHAPADFEQRVRDVLESVAKGKQIKITPTFHPHAFPDIRANGFGVEVKTVNKDSWLSVGNSVFEGMRDAAVKKIYVVFGKFGGMLSACEADDPGASPGAGTFNLTMPVCMGSHQCLNWCSIWPDLMSASMVLALV
jgi:hypothetical protein